MINHIIEHGDNERRAENDATNNQVGEVESHIVQVTSG